jgi:GAF domain-containing protein
MTGPLNPNSYRQQEAQRLKRENDELKEEVEGLRKFVDSLDQLYEATDGFKGDSELFEFLRGTLVTAMKILNAPDGSLALLDEDSQELVFVIVIGGLADKLTNQRMPVTQGVAGWVVRHAKPTLVRDVRLDQRFYTGVDDRFSFKTQSIAAAPLLGDGKVYGLVEVLNKPGNQPFDDKDMGLLKLFCRAAGEALANIDRMGNKQPVEQKKAE